jgi:pimeloyl-ACP methyl ester carboxylesterase
MSAVTLKNELVHYEVFGRGPALILVHGWLGSWRYWIPTMQQLSTGYRTYALDLWGFGDSGKKPDLYAFDQQVALVGAFMDKLGITKAAMVGHALGAAVVVRFATKHPDQIARLMTVSLPVVGDASLNQRVTTTSPANWLERLVDKGRADYQAIKAEAGKADKDALRVSAQALSTTDWRPELGKLKAPCVLVHGQQDPLVHIPEESLFDGLNRNVHRVMLDDSRHFPMLDETSAFNRLVVDFLEAKDAKAISDLRAKKPWVRRVR